MSIHPIVKSIIIVQLLIATLIIFQIYNKKNKTNLQINLSPLDKSAIQHEEVDGLRYYYYLVPNKIVLWSSDFLKKSFDIVYNNDGLNDTNGYSIKKKPNTFRIIALGDSFTYGVFVRTKDNWTEQLENKLNEKQICKNITKFEVINLGVPGYDPTYEAARYKKIGQKYNPDLIVWMLTDLTRIDEKRIPLMNECKKNKFLDKVCWKSIESDIIKENGMDYIINTQKEAINQLKNIYNKHIFFVDYYNTHHQVIDDIKDSTNFNELFTKKYMLKNYDSNAILFPDNHPNELGHKLIADILYEQLLKSNQIPCISLEQK